MIEDDKSFDQSWKFCKALLYFCGQLLVIQGTLLTNLCNLHN